MRSNSTHFNGGPGASQGREGGLQVTYTTALFQVRGLYDEIRDAANGQLDNPFTASREYFAGVNVFLGQFKLQAVYQASRTSGMTNTPSGTPDDDRSVMGRRDVASYAGCSFDRGGLSRECKQRWRQRQHLHGRRFVQPVEAYIA